LSLIYSLPARLHKALKHMPDECAAVHLSCPDVATMFVAYRTSSPEYIDNALLHARVAFFDLGPQAECVVLHLSSENFCVDWQLYFLAVSECDWVFVDSHIARCLVLFFIA